MKVAPLGKNCPVCQKSLDINTFLPGQGDVDKSIKPEPNDITYCFNCDSVLVFNEAIEIVVPNEIQLYYIVHDPDFARFVMQIKEARKIKPNMN